MRFIIVCMVLGLALAAGLTARAEEEGDLTSAGAAQVPAQESALDKLGDWYATIGKSPEEAARIVEERRLQRAQAAESGLDQYKNAVMEKAGELKAQADARIEAARVKVKEEAARMPDKIKQKAEAKVKEKVDQKSEEIKKNAKAKMDAQGERLKKAVDKKTKGFFSDMMK